ncbi:hypothetical protein GOP47_0002471 [Adiantum capillus-veneris]|uniref:Glycosyltransferase family 92 protein n=1 Tax=Adiantum capillus-veneris TaxID=13818 RepID=A0A9D4VBT9_ADICA|nr:hypothetical protein GOP47_0002471 [Adiantum capillus-veneris]
MEMLSSTQKSRASKSWHLCVHIDVKSFLAGMLLMGFVLLLQQSLVNLTSSITYSTNSPLQIPCHDHHHPHNDSTQLLADDITHSPVEVNHDSKFNDEARDEHTQIATHDEFATDLDDGDHFENGMVTSKQSFHAYGSASALFVHMASYRGGPDSFAVIGLGAKPAHVYGIAGFECEWVPAKNANNSSSSRPIKGSTRKFLPDWNMGRQYTVVVVNCSFEEPVGVDREGGRLVVYALYGDGSGMPDTTPERIVALMETKNEYDANKFLPPYPYDYVYCGSPLYGGLNVQRMREWIAYHVKVFGKHAHFFLYDAGGITEGVARALRPWQKRGFVTVHDIREQERYDGYYHNQFLVVNDCLHRARFLSNWTFFFDVDEFLWLPPHESLGAVMQGFSNYTQVIFRQKPMAAHICQAHQHNISRKWGLEKLVYRNVKAGQVWDRKYAIQPRNAFTTGVHRSDHIVGNDIVRESLGYFPESLVPKLWYYHFHNTITHFGELCRTFTNANSAKPINVSWAKMALEPADFYDVDGTPFRVDSGLQELAQSIKDFECVQIGTQPTILE